MIHVKNYLTLNCVFMYMHLYNIYTFILLKEQTMAFHTLPSIKQGAQFYCFVFIRRREFIKVHQTKQNYAMIIQSLFFC